MRGLKINESHVRLLKLAAQGQTQSQMAKELHVGAQNIFARVEALEKYGYIVKSRRGLITELLLTEKARMVLNSFTKDFNVPPHRMRLHNLEVAYELLNPLRPDEPVQLVTQKGLDWKPSGLKNQDSVSFTYKEIQAWLYPTSLVLYAPNIEMPLDASVAQLQAHAISLLATKAEEFESKLGIKLKRLSKGTLASRVVSIHIALTNNEVAESVRERGDKLIIKDDQDGKARVIVDHSNGLDELEAVHGRHAFEDAEALKNFTKAVYTHEFDYKEEKQARMDILATLAEQNRFFITHNKLMADISKLVRKLDRGLSQKRLFP